MVILMIIIHDEAMTLFEIDWHLLLGREIAAYISSP
jgi:hypothetical protein